MAENFRVVVYQRCENLHLGLEGDFDGTSAYELLNALEARTIGEETGVFWISPRKVLSLQGLEKDTPSIARTSDKSSSLILRIK